MKINKKTIILCIISLILLALLVFWIRSQRDIDEPEVIMTQEEYQMEILEILDNIMLLAYPVGSWTNEWEPKAEISPGVEIFYDRLARFTHVRNLERHPSNFPSLEDIISLYNSYDEELDRRLRNLQDWWRHTGKGRENLYIWAIVEAMHYYTQRYGAFNGKESYTEMRLDDMIALETYLRDNPRFLPDARLRRFL